MTTGPLGETRAQSSPQRASSAARPLSIGRVRRGACGSRIVGRAERACGERGAARARVSGAMGAAAGTLAAASDEQGAQMVDKLRALSTVEREPLLKALADESIPEAAAAEFVTKFLELNQPGVASAELWKQIRPPAPADGAAKPAVRAAPRRARRAEGVAPGGGDAPSRARVPRLALGPRERRRAFVSDARRAASRAPACSRRAFPSWTPALARGGSFVSRRRPTTCQPSWLRRWDSRAASCERPRRPARRARARRAFFRKGRESRARRRRARALTVRARASRRLARSRRRPRRRRRSSSSRARTRAGGATRKRTSSRRRWSSSSNDPSARASPRPIRGSAGAMKPRPLSPWCSGTIRARSPTATTAATS